MATEAVAQPIPRRRYGGLLEWLVTTDHKKIGIMYLVVNVLFFFIGGVFALVMRLQLAQPNGTIVSEQQYNQIFTMHGTTMLFLFIIPIGAAFANYVLPLMIGARDMAFPRINALAFWLIPLAGIIMYSGFLVKGGAAAAGWTGYPPLSSSTFSPGHGIDLWDLGLLILGISSAASSINLVATAMTMRAPGMTLGRMPVFVWMVIVTSVLIIFAVPVFAAVLTMLLFDRTLGTNFFNPQGGGNPILYQQLFWFYSHPAVYIMILPMFGAISEIIPVFSRKPLFGRTTVILAGAAIGLLGFMVWMHHMFTTGLNVPLTGVTMGTTMLIAVPTGIKMFNWLATMWQGSISFKAPMLFAVGFLLLFLIGGIDGVFSAVVPVDYAINDTYWIVGHIHYVLFGGSVFGVFAALYFWFPKMTGRFLDEGLAKVQFAFMFVGMNMAFMPMHVEGLMGMPRRIATYPAGHGWGIWNLISTIGAFLIAVGMVVFIANFLKSMRGPQNAGADPWEANTLEWITSSPPPEHNFDTLPPIHSDTPAKDARLAREQAVVF